MFLLFIEIIFETWKKLPGSIKYEYTHRMKVEVFWLPMLLQRRKYSRTLEWALDVNLIDKK